MEWNRVDLNTSYRPTTWAHRVMSSSHQHPSRLFFLFLIIIMLMLYFLSLKIFYERGIVARLVIKSSHPAPDAWPDIMSLVCQVSIYTIFKNHLLIWAQSKQCKLPGALDLLMYLEPKIYTLTKCFVKFKSTNNKTIHFCCCCCKEKIWCLSSLLLLRNQIKNQKYSQNGRFSATSMYASPEANLNAEENVLPEHYWSRWWHPRRW